MAAKGREIAGRLVSRRSEESGLPGHARLQDGIEVGRRFLLFRTDAARCLRTFSPVGDR